MGKGFNNYMCKKFFHPASRDNLKRVWMAQQKDDAYKKKQEELRIQYEKEQDLYNNKAMLSKESKDKLSVNFMYEPPPGAKKEREKEENEPEYKFEWQRKYNAPREDYCKGNAEIQDQPFGILVRNVRCIKCRKWGHINTDKECPLYNQSVTSEIGASAEPGGDAVSLLRGMREDGLRMRKTALEAQQHVEIPRYKGMVNKGDEDVVDETELDFLKGLSTKEKLKLLKKLEKLEANGVKNRDLSTDSESDSDDGRKSKKKKNKTKKSKIRDKSKKRDKKVKKSKKYDEDSEDSSDSDEEDVPKKKKKSKKEKEAKSKTKEKKKSSRKRDDSDDSDSEDEKRKSKEKSREIKKKSKKRKRVVTEKESDSSDSDDESSEEDRKHKNHHKKKRSRKSDSEEVSDRYSRR